MADRHYCKDCIDCVRVKGISCCARCVTFPTKKATFSCSLFRVKTENKLKPIPVLNSIQRRLEAIE